MSPQELKEKLAPVVRATLEEMRQEDEMTQDSEETQEPHLEEQVVPQVRLARRPATSEIPSD
jgi:hypothetical protein